MEIVKSASIFLASFLGCLFIIRSFDRPPAREPVRVTAPAAPAASANAARASNGPTAAEGGMSGNGNAARSGTETIPLEDGWEITENREFDAIHQQDLDTASDEEFARYAEGKINFDLLRKTRAAATPPPEFPGELKRLDGKRVQIVGFMAPYDDIQVMKTFMLFPSFAGCFFCEAPSIEEAVLVRQAAEEPPWIADPVIVDGTLNLWREDSGDPAHLMFLYTIDGATVTRRKPL